MRLRERFRRPASSRLRLPNAQLRHASKPHRHASKPLRRESELRHPHGAPHPRESELSPPGQRRRRVQSWTGNQAGGFGGGNAGAGSFADPVLHPCAAAVPVFPVGSLGFDGTCPSAVPFSFSNTKGSFTGGGFIGRNVQIGNWVVGVEGDIAGKSNSEASYTQATTTVAPYVFSSFTAVATRTDLISGSVRQGTDGSIRPRIGWLLTPWSMLYITGGIAFEHISASYTYFSTITYTNLFSSSSVSPVTAVDTLAGSASFDKTLTGGTVGAGYEVAIAYGLKVRFEYRWTGFGGQSFDVPLARSCSGSGCAVAGLPPSASSAHIDLGNIAFHTFRAGVGFDF